VVDKLEFTQIVRYFFSGMVAVLAIAVWTGTTMETLMLWRKENTWVTDAGSITILLSLLLLCGYVLFTFYRSLIYTYIIIWCKAWLCRRLKIDTYREYVQGLYSRTPDGIVKASSVRACCQSIMDFFLRTTNGGLSVFEAERFYALMKVTDLGAFYKESGVQLTTGLHFLYYTGLALLIGTFGRLSELWPWSIGLLGFLLLVVIADLHFERLERLLFMSKATTVQLQMNALIEAGAYGTRPLPTGGAQPTQ
jgi:hypothetical protein